ncbi:hypothetical protein KP509_13G015500 [Ceratopteris richardii]|nr:hypothetical protein KP509_13G015500 [Ceratopteris richardii]
MVDHYFSPFQKHSEELHLPDSHREFTSAKMAYPKL